MKNPRNIRQLKCLLAIVALPCSAVNSYGVILLQDIVLPGTQSTVYWESPALNNASDLSPTSGSGTIAPVSPGYQASAGFYSWGGDYGATASTTAGFDIQNVVFQLVMMQNDAFTYEESLNYDGTYMSGFDPETGYAGGPILYVNGATDNGIQATLSGLIAGPSEQTVGGFTGEVSSYAWQWDLSGVTDTISSIEIMAPIIIHQSTFEARIDTSSAYTQVIPEPETTAAMAATAVLALTLLVRRRQRRA